MLALAILFQRFRTQRLSWISIKTIDPIPLRRISNLLLPVNRRKKNKYAIDMLWKVHTAMGLVKWKEITTSIGLNDQTTFSIEKLFELLAIYLHWMSFDQQKPFCREEIFLRISSHTTNATEATELECFLGAKKNIKAMSRRRNFIKFL